MKSSSRWRFPHQRAKRERQQPSDRASLGFLEKKKDYLKRAERTHKKADFIKGLRREAVLRNPDEFYFSMITDTASRPVETKSRPLSTFTKDQQLLLQTRDQNYIRSKLQSHRKHLSDLHLRAPTPHAPPTRFFATYEDAAAAWEAEREAHTHVEEDDEMSELLAEIAQRERIVAELEAVLQEMQLQKDLADGQARQVVDDEGNVSYAWERERKR
jgi:U3 small nucleolar RNA-associated protein 11